MRPSHLYAGFRYAGALPSVLAQRRIQGKMLCRMCPRNLLSVGCAFGDELGVLLSYLNDETPELIITAIDVADVEGILRSHWYAMRLGPRLRWMRVDLLNSSQLPEYGDFDLVQCGFVLHDVEYEDKDRAMMILANAVRPGGYIVISDIFVSPTNAYSEEVGRIYDIFLSEAELAYRSGQLGVEEWQLLVGYGMQPGLIRSKDEAMRGTRDFFDTLTELIERSMKAGCELCSIVTNQLNNRLKVLVMRRWKGNETNL